MIPVCCAVLLAASVTVEPFAAGVKFIEPFGVDFDKAGNAYVIEYKGNRLWKIAPGGAATVLAGPDQLKEPHGIAISPEQQLYIADTHNNRILRRDLKTGVTTTVAGNGEAGFSGDGGPAIQASFKGIFAIALDPAGRNLYVADLSNIRVRRIDLRSGIVTTIAGNGTSAIPDDGAIAATGPLVDPRAVAADGKGNVYILERRGNALRVVDRSGRIRTLIRPGQIQPDLKGPKHVCLDRNGDVIIADAENHLVRRYSLKSGTVTTIAGTGEAGDRIVTVDPLKTQLARPHGVYVHRDGTLYISDSYNHRLLRMRD